MHECMRNVILPPAVSSSVMKVTLTLMLKFPFLPISSVTLLSLSPTVYETGSNHTSVRREWTETCTYTATWKRLYYLKECLIRHILILWYLEGRDWNKQCITSNIQYTSGRCAVPYSIAEAVERSCSLQLVVINTREMGHLSCSLFPRVHHITIVRRWQMRTHCSETHMMPSALLSKYASWPYL